MYFGCAGSSLQHARSLLQRAGSSVVAWGLLVVVCGLLVLVVQWVRLCTPNIGSPGLIPGR